MSKIYVQPLVHDTFSDFVDFADDNKFNLEIATFAYANVYDTDWHKILREHEERLFAFKGKISFHGVFQDVLVHSSDKKIAESSKERVLDSLKAAKNAEGNSSRFPWELQSTCEGQLFQEKLGGKKPCFLEGSS